MNARLTLERGARAALLVLAAACGPSSSSSSRAEGRVDTAARDDVDSVVLERTRCFGACPAYRLVVARDGAVTFTSHDGRDTTRATDRVAPARFAELARGAAEAGLYALPAVIASDPVLCARRRTDAPTVTTTLFAAGRPTRVERYAGCAQAASEAPAAPIVRLQAFEDRVDSVAGAARWVRPATRR